MHKNAITSKILGLLLMAGCIPALSAAESIPERFHGTWVIDIVSTSEKIANEASMSADIKEAWLTHSATLLRFDYVISEDTIENWTRSGAPGKSWRHSGRWPNL